MLCTKIVLNVKTKQKQQFVHTTCSAGILSLQLSRTMNNLSSYCGLVVAKIRASDKDSPVLANLAWQKMIDYCQNRQSRFFFDSIFKMTVWKAKLCMFFIIKFISYVLHFATVSLWILANLTCLEIINHCQKYLTTIKMFWTIRWIRH